MTLKILCKLSTETKRYSSHTILQNFNLLMKQWFLLLTAIHWRRHSNALPSWHRWSDDSTTHPECSLVPDDWRWWRSDILSSHLVWHDQQSWKLVDRRPLVRTASCWRIHRNVPSESSATGHVAEQLHTSRLTAQLTGTWITTSVGTIYGNSLELSHSSNLCLFCIISVN